MEVVHGLSGLASAREHWERLTRRDHRYWLQFPYFEEMLRHVPWGSESVAFYLWRDAAGGVQAIVPLRFQRLPIRRVSFNCAVLVASTFDEVTCQSSSCDFPCAGPAEAEQALRAVVAHLRRSSAKASVLLLGRVTRHSAAYAAASAVETSARPFAAVGGSKWMSVDRPFAELKKALSGKFKISLRSTRRNLDALGLVEFGTTVRGDADFDRVFDEFLQIEASGWKGADGTGTGLLVNATSNQRDFLTALAKRSDVSTMELHRLTVNGECIASQLWMREGTCRVAFKIGYREEYARYQPGHLLIEHVLADSCADATLTSVDFVSDAAWLDKWRVEYEPWHHCYLPISRVGGTLASQLLRVPSRDHWRIPFKGAPNAKRPD